LPSVLLAQAIGTLAFSPAQPTTNDSITVIFTPALGQLDLCPLGFSVGTGFVYINSTGLPCTPGFGTEDRVVIGKLPAATYQVTWDLQDNFTNEQVPTTTLLVRLAPVQVPMLSLTGMSLLTCGLALLGSLACKIVAS
jgi:hypothetical protein